MSRRPLASAIFFGPVAIAARVVTVATIVWPSLVVGSVSAWSTSAAPARATSAASRITWAGMARSAGIGMSGRVFRLFLLNVKLKAVEKDTVPLVQRVLRLRLRGKRHESEPCARTRICVLVHSDELDGAELGEGGSNVLLRHRRRQSTDEDLVAVVAELSRATGFAEIVPVGMIPSPVRFEGTEFAASLVPAIGRRTRRDWGRILRRFVDGQAAVLRWHRRFGRRRLDERFGCGRLGRFGLRGRLERRHLRGRHCGRVLRSHSRRPRQGRVLRGRRALSLDRLFHLLHRSSLLLNAQGLGRRRHFFH